MRIVFLSREYPPALHGGIGTYTRTIGQALAERGHTVHVVTWTEQHEQTSSDGPVRVHWVRTSLVRPLCQSPLRWLNLYERYPSVGEWIGWSYSAYRKVLEINRKQRVDIIEAPDFVAQGYATSFSRSLPLVVKLHNPISLIADQLRLPPSQGEELGWRFEEWAVKRADLITSPSRALGNLLAQRWRLKADCIHILPLPVDEVLFHPGSVACPSDPVILYVGSLGRTKGTKALLDAFAHFGTDFPTATLRLIGVEHSEREIQQASYAEYVLESYGREVGNRITFVGRLPHSQLVDEYRASSVVVVPSGLFDNFPNTCLEAMACGKPVVGTDRGGIPEVIEDGVTGLVVPANEPVALAQALARFVANPALARRMGALGRLRVEEKYATKVIVGQTLQLYQEAVRKAFKWHKGLSN